MRNLLGPALALMLAVSDAATPAAAAPSVFLEHLTTAEVSAALQAGKTTIIIPVGGVEQNGPHMALGKHNFRARALAGMIATELGDAIVAPTVNYVPEGNVSPPTEHMRFAGTISIPFDVFKGVLKGAALSLKQHGFKHIVLLGDSGNYQTALKAVADGLNSDWAKSETRAQFVAEYYQAGQTQFVQALKNKGLSAEQIGSHAGAADTSLLMAVDAATVKPELFAAAAKAGWTGGTAGDPRPASAELGKIGVDAMVKASVAAIHKARTAKSM
jgi:creatinine amidohydrolase